MNERRWALAELDVMDRAGFTRVVGPVFEQATAGLDRVSAHETAMFQKFNIEHRARFGFPFVISARMNRKETILAAFPMRLRNSCEREIRAALDEIAKIARLRLDDLILT